MTQKNKLTLATRACLSRSGFVVSSVIGASLLWATACNEDDTTPGAMTGDTPTPAPTVVGAGVLDAGFSINDLAVDGGPGLDVDVSAPVPTLPVSRGAVLASAGACVVDSYTGFLAAAQALSAATGTWAAAPSSVDGLVGAQQAWQAAMDAWQVAELSQVGPAAMGDTPGGLELRNLVYSWPVTNRCRVEFRVVEDALQGRPKVLPKLRSRGTVARRSRTLCRRRAVLTLLSICCFTPGWTTTVPPQVTSTQAASGRA